jgi:hypothetical protein
VAVRLPVWHCAAMRASKSLAGGVFVTIGSLGGFAFGIAAGDPLGWTLVGTAAGILAAILVWLIDRRRG